ncbi:hypothetical protein [Mycobacterium sp. 1274761.0]|uniref:hypothetical protein n=1 Tax=Mycobacterium sp. 1274761.0 TaxID=1834077 RepID=UPI0008023FB9|nr:hypothetical protein [Mycobacterium sp. 1274761.0]OBK76292.1 hypothetical protein A5651_06710 [Mycobacterium sp. 1274761.0]
MGGKRVVGSIVTTASIALGALGTAPPAQADAPNLNGRYQALSNGQFARTNDVFKDERTIVETWDISTTCKSPIECLGEVKSSAGWTAPITYDGDVWNVKRAIPNWEACPDGTYAEGAQNIIFWGIDPVKNERRPTFTTLLGGRDITMSPSGSCGINKSLQIELPFRLDKL